MLKSKSMKTYSSDFWIKILWCVVIIFAWTLLAYIRYSKSGSIIGFSIYPYILSPYLIGYGVCATLLSITKVITRRSFIYILAGLSNGYIGLLGFYLELIGKNTKPDLIVVFLICNVVFGAGILIDAWITNSGHKTK